MIRSVSSPAENPFVAEVLGERSARPCESRICRGTCGILDDAYRASHLAAPLWIGDQVIGALCVGSRHKGQFSEDSSVLLTRLANAAAVALGNARLYAQAERAAALEERQRIAGQMHDGLAQMVNYLGLVVDQAGDQLEQGQVDAVQATLARVRSGLDGASKEVRRSIASLQDELPPSKDLQQLLSDLVQEVVQGEQGQVEWVTELDGSLSLGHEDTQQVLGVAQEALQNARRYSGASRVYLRLATDGQQAALTVEDNGRGFDPAASPEDGRRHFGLAILHARAARLEGTLEVRSAPGAGACLTLTWPIRRAPAPARTV
jgi:two-component system nitrate/nitrite sensor histidine kinase NarX